MFCILENGLVKNVKYNTVLDLKIINPIKRIKVVQNKENPESLTQKWRFNDDGSISPLGRTLPELEVVITIAKHKVNSILLLYLFLKLILKYNNNSIEIKLKYLIILF